MVGGENHSLSLYCSNSAGSHHSHCISILDNLGHNEIPLQAEEVRKENYIVNNQRNNRVLVVAIALDLTSYMNVCVLG